MVKTAEMPDLLRTGSFFMRKQLKYDMMDRIGTFGLKPDCRDVILNIREDCSYLFGWRR